MAFIAPVLTAMGASAATAATVSSVVSYAGMAATVIGGISQAQAAKDAAAANLKMTKYSAQSSINAAKSQQNLLNAQANEAEAISQIAAQQKRRELNLKLSRAYAVAAAQGGGELPENLAGELVEQGETAAQYELYSGSTKGSNLRWQGAQNLAATEATAANAITAAKVRKDQADSAFMPTVLGSVVKAAGMSALLPGAAPGATLASATGGLSSTVELASSPLSESLGIYGQSTLPTNIGSLSFAGRSIY